jgi:hypothetical protein
MATTFLIKCDKCDHSFYTSGSWEFYRDIDGNIEHFGHPGPISKEAEERGIWGFYDSMYCPDCGQVNDIVISEFRKPFVSREEYIRNFFLKPSLSSFFSLLFKPKLNREKRITPECPICGSKKVICDPPKEAGKINCPRCEEGTLQWRKHSVC